MGGIQASQIGEEGEGEYQMSGKEGKKRERRQETGEQTGGQRGGKEIDLPQVGEMWIERGKEERGNTQG